MTALETSVVMKLSPYLQVTGPTAVLNGLKGPHVIFKGVNLHLRNNKGKTDYLNGLGNLIIGYDENYATPAPRSGSHNLVIGPFHGFSAYGGLIAGFHNTVSGNYASVSGGIANTASGTYSAVSGGDYRSVSGQYDWRAGAVFQED